MNPRYPSRVALAVFDRFLPDNDALHGDLVEEFFVRKSQFWLWRQVMLAVIWHSWQPFRWRRLDPQMIALGVAVLVLLAFEAVLVTNVMHRLLFGPSLPAVRSISPSTILIVVTAIPAGWLIAGFHRAHRALSLAAFSASVIVCVMFNLRAPFVVQFFAALLFIIGLIGGASLNPATHEQKAAVDQAEPPTPD
jgi:hypothetical protein